MANVVTINRRDVVELISRAAARFTGGNKTEAVARALRQMLDQDDRGRPLYGAHRDSMWMDPAWDLTGPTFEEGMFDAAGTAGAAGLAPRARVKKTGRARGRP